MQITIIGHRGGSIQTTIPRQILSALSARAGDYITWTWNTKGHAEVRRLLRAEELAARTPTPKNSRKLRRRRRET